MLQVALAAEPVISPIKDTTSPYQSCSLISLVCLGHLHHVTAKKGGVSA